MDIGSTRSQKLYGVHIGIVTDNKHPDGKYEVKCQLPEVRDKTGKFGEGADKEDFLTMWCRIASVFAGGVGAGKTARGFYFLPEVEDEVLIMFYKGNIEHPIIIGSLWNGKDLPPFGDNAPSSSTSPGPVGNDLRIDAVAKDNNALGGKNDSRYIVSRCQHLLMFNDSKDPAIVLRSSSGNTIILDDTSGKECITIFTKTEKEYIELDTKEKKITIESKDGDIHVMCKNGTFTLECKDFVTKTMGGNVDHKTDGNVTSKQDGTATYESSGATTIKGSKIDLNP